MQGCFVTELALFWREVKPILISYCLKWLVPFLMVWYAPHAPSCRWLETSDLSSCMTLLPCYRGSSCHLRNQPGCSISHIVHRRCCKAWEMTHRLERWAEWLILQTPHLRTYRRHWDRVGVRGRPPQCSPHWWAWSGGRIVLLMHAVFHCSFTNRRN